MDEMELEKFFDKSIANDTWMIEEEELTKEEELCISLLPDELLTRHHQASQVNTSETGETAKSGSTSGATYQNSKNATGEAMVLKQGRSLVCTVTSVIPAITTMELPEIKNVISTAKLCCHLDLQLIAQKVWNVEYKPKSHRAITMRLRKPQSTGLIYTSGNIVCSGAKSEDQSRRAIRRYARILQKLGFPVSILNLKIHNIVASCKAFPVSLERLLLAHHKRCSYEPELFPGLFFTVKPSFIITIFATGKIIFTGAKNLSDIEEAFHIIYPIINSFRRVPLLRD